ncbi:MAG TPA: hypothetical protein VMU99_06055 [Acidimicrobiales bacterium]|nr:hypothetical protein [Acidimicrobiales bacterium]
MGKLDAKFAERIEEIRCEETHCTGASGVGRQDKKTFLSLER